MELIAFPARKLGAAWILAAMIGGVLLTLTGLWPLQVAGGLLMLASLVSPLVYSTLREQRLVNQVQVQEDQRSESRRPSAPNPPREPRQPTRVRFSGQGSGVAASGPRQHATGQTAPQPRQGATSRKSPRNGGRTVEQAKSSRESTKSPRSGFRDGDVKK